MKYSISIGDILLSLLTVALAFILNIAANTVSNTVGSYVCLFASDSDKAAEAMFSKLYTVFYTAAGVLFLVLFLLIRSRFNIPQLRAVSFKKVRPRRILVYTFISGLFISMLFICILTVVKLPQKWLDDNAESTGTFKEGYFIFSVLSSMIIAPINEEIIFRGVMYNSLKYPFRNIDTKSGKIIVTVLSALCVSIIFGMFHGNILQAIYTGVLSFIMILIYEHTGSLVSTILYHAAFNSARIILAPLYSLRLGFLSMISIACVAVSVTLLFIFSTPVKDNITSSFSDQ